MTIIDSDIYQKFSLQRNQAKDEDPNRLAQEDFLKLMITQLKNQDPFKPMENGEFLGQMAQFSTVSGIGDLKKTFEQFGQGLAANQVLQAANLIGKEALVEGDTVRRASDTATVEGAFDVPGNRARAELQVYDASGTLVRRVALGEVGNGRHGFTWDGRDEEGRPAPAGQYRFQVQLTRPDGQSEAARVLLYSRIDSVNMDKGKVTLNTADGSTREFGSIVQLR